MRSHDTWSDSVFARLTHLSRKAWTYALGVLEQPGEVPFVLQHAARGCHLGELLKLNKHKSWLRGFGVNTVLDIGAHAGEFSSAARAVLPWCRLIAFEPLPEPYKRLLQRFCDDPLFEAYNIALGDQKWTIDFWESSFTKASSVLKMDRLHMRAFPWSSELKRATVQMDVLDSILSPAELQPLVLMKLDVQGFEHSVLAGAAETLRRIDIVLAEVSFQPLYESQSYFEEVYELLSLKGFRYAGSMDTMLSPLDQSIMQEDAVFVKESSQMIARPH